VEEPSPRVETEQYDIRVRLVTRVERSAQDGARAEQRERIGGHRHAPETRRALARLHHQSRLGDSDGVGERAGACPPFEELRIADALLVHRTSGPVRNVLDHAHEALGGVEGERLQQDRVHHTVDGRRGADAD
jgi:hypothetical protein